MSTQKMIRELKRVARDELGAKITCETTRRSIFRAEATFPDGRTMQFHIHSSPTNEEHLVNNLMRRLRRFKEAS